jgi:hypothetical protein
VDITEGWIGGIGWVSFVGFDTKVFLCFFSFVFFFPQPAAAGWGKQNQANNLL